MSGVAIGGYVVLLLPTLVLLLGRLRTRKDNNAHTTILIVLCLLFLCCTAHFALEFNHFYTTLVRVTHRSVLCIFS